MQDKIFHSICFGFVFGIFLRSFTSVDLYLVILFIVIALALFLFFKFISLNKWGIIFSIFIFAFSLGIYRFHIEDMPPSGFFESKVGHEADFEGEIIEEPDRRENNQKLTVKITLNGEKTKILLTTILDEEYKYGDLIEFTGKLEKPVNFVTDQGKEFDYINYLRKDGILYVMSYPELAISSGGNGNFIKSALFSVKEKFLGKMNMAIAYPESLLMGGFILGEKASFSEELRQKFINTGTIHIVALSGYNITIVAEWFMKLFSFLPQNLGIGMGILAILLFVLMTGGSSTAIRAGVMASLALIARATGRNYDVARALILAGVLMILINPLILVHDVSFQLSFIATVAVIFFAPRIEKYFMWITDSFKLRDIITVTFAVYIFVLPFILYKMGNLSLVALPANILILPFIPFTMMLGFLTSFLGIVWYGLAVPTGFISYLFLHYELGVINFFSNFSYAALYVPNFPLLLTVAIYAYFIYWLFGRGMRDFFTAPF